MTAFDFVLTRLETSAWSIVIGERDPTETWPVKAPFLQAGMVTGERGRRGAPKS